MGNKVNKCQRIGDIVISRGDYYMVVDSYKSKIVVVPLVDGGAQFTNKQEISRCDVTLLYKRFNKTENWQSYIRDVEKIIAQIFNAPVNHETMERYIYDHPKLLKRYRHLMYLEAGLKVHKLTHRLLDQVIMLMLQPYITS